MGAWFGNSILSTENYIDFIVRIVLSVICGGILGAEREKRMKNAGLRTHIIVALTACVTMIISKYGFMDTAALPDIRLNVDTSRLAHGVVSAIGFLGAGVIFIKRESIIGLTTAAGLWATVAIGMAIGAGMYSIGVLTTLIIMLIQWVLHNHHAKSHSQCIVKLSCNLTAHNISLEEFKKHLEKHNMSVREICLEKKSDIGEILNLEVLFEPKDNLIEVAELVNEDPFIDSAEIYPAL